MLSRNNIDYTKKLNDIAQSLKKIDQNSFVLDGEVVIFDKNGKSDFGLLQESIKMGSSSLYYCIFDLLSLNDTDLRKLPLIERKAKLERLLFKSENNLIYSSHVDNGKETFDFAKRNNLEGIIAKKKNSIYTGKRTDDWLKIKCYARQEFVIAGYTTSDKNTVLSALLLGYYKNKKLVYAGKVGTGFDEKDRKHLVDAFQSVIIKDCPFSDKIKVNNSVWIKPKFVAEIQFAEFTKDNLLRQPSFVGLRPDKKAKDVVLEVKNGKN